MKIPPGVPGFVVAMSTLGAGFRVCLGARIDVSLCVIAIGQSLVAKG
jgi:hypothetical protein